MRNIHLPKGNTMSKNLVSPADRIRHLNDIILNPDRPYMTPKEIFILYKDALMAEYYGQKEKKNAIRHRRMRRRVYTHLAVLNLRNDMEDL